MGASGAHEFVAGCLLRVLWVNCAVFPCLAAQPCGPPMLAVLQPGEQLMLAGCLPGLVMQTGRQFCRTAADTGHSLLAQV